MGLGDGLEIDDGEGLGEEDVDGDGLGEGDVLVLGMVIMGSWGGTILGDTGGAGAGGGDITG